MLKFFQRRRSRINNFSIKSDEDKILALMRHALNASNVNVNQGTALQVGAVFACVNVIAGTLSMLPLQVFRKIGERRVEANDREMPLAYALRHEAFPGIPAQSVIFANAANLALRGNAFSHIGRNGNGQPVSLSPLETALMSWEERTERWLYSPRGVAGEQRRYTPSELLHIRNFTLSGGAGLDTLGMAKEAVGLAIALDTNAAKFFANNSRIGTVFESERSLGPENRKALEQKLKENYEGVHNAHRSLILENGLKQAANRSPNDESQLDESRKHQVVDVCRFFGVPPHKVGVENNIPRANAEEANIAFITNTLSRYATLVENTMNVQLLGRANITRGFYVKFNLGALLRGTLVDRYNAYSVGRQWGWLSANDIRALEDLDPIPNGDRYLEPVNMVEAGSQLEEPNNMIEEPNNMIEEPEARFLT